MKKLIALSLVLMLLLGACGGGKPSASAPAGTDSTASSGGASREIKDTITWAQTADVTSLDPHVGKETVAVTVNTQMYSTLMRVTGDSGPQPYLAESYKQLSDTEWEFTLRKDVKFHDGSPMTAEDVKFSLDRAIASSYVSYVVSFIDSVTITGENTIVIKTKGAYAPILNNLSLPFSGIVSKAYVEKNGDEYLANNPMGTGPYKFVSWNPGDSIKLEANPDYFLGEPPTKNLVMKVIPEAAQRVIAMETGEVDIAYTIISNDVSKIESNSDLVAVARPSLTCYNYYFNLKKGPTTDENLRKALCHAIDRQIIIDSIMRGKGVIAQNMISPSVAGYVEGAPIYEYDVAKAKEYLAKSAYPDGKVTLTLVVNDNQERVEISQVVQQMLKDNLGITVDIKSYEQATYLQTLNAGEHDLGFSAWITSTADADYTYFPLYHSSSESKAGNRSFFGDPKADELILKGRTTSDLGERKKIYSELNDVIYDICPQLFICHPIDTVALNKKVEGFTMNNDGYHQYDKVVCYK